MRGIFISYRRDDAEGQAGRLFDDLSAHFGPDAVFMDVAGIKKGLDFRRIIDEHVTSCGVLLVLIGKRWLDVTDGKGNRRLDDPNDFVRLETAAALSRDIPVVPVLVHDAAMPTEQDLPDALKELAFRNGTELTHARWESDVKLLIEDLRPYLDLPPAAARTIPAVQPTRERSVVTDTPPLRTSRRAGGRSLWVTAAAVAIASGVSIAGYHYWPDTPAAQNVALVATQIQTPIKPRGPNGTAAAAVTAAATPPAASPASKVASETAKADAMPATETEAQRIASETAAAATVAAARAASVRANAEAAARAAAARKDAQDRRERADAERATQLAAEQRKRDEENQRILLAQAEQSRIAAAQAEKNRIAAEQAAAAKMFTDIAGAFINGRGNRR